MSSRLAASLVAVVVARLVIACGGMATTRAIPDESTPPRDAGADATSVIPIASSTPSLPVPDSSTPPLPPLQIPVCVMSGGACLGGPPCDGTLVPLACAAGSCCMPFCPPNVPNDHAPCTAPSDHVCSYPCMTAQCMDGGWVLKSCGPPPAGNGPQ